MWVKTYSFVDSSHYNPLAASLAGSGSPTSVTDFAQTVDSGAHLVTDASLDKNI